MWSAQLGSSPAAGSEVSWVSEDSEECGVRRGAMPGIRILIMRRAPSAFRVPHQILIGMN